jgi:hypothetical protein
VKDVDLFKGSCYRLLYPLRSLNKSLIDFEAGVTVYVCVCVFVRVCVCVFFIFLTKIDGWMNFLAKHPHAHYNGKSWHRFSFYYIIAGSAFEKYKDLYYNIQYIFAILVLFAVGSGKKYTFKKKKKTWVGL